MTVGRPRVTAQMVRDRVVRLIPTAKLGLAPHDATLINIQTIMWVDAPQTRTLAPVTILGQRVLIRLKIDHVAWNFGDGNATTSNGPGKPYDQTDDPCRAAQCPDYFGHTYRGSGHDTVSATASWSASFTINGGNPVAIPGTVAGPTATTPVAVKQARAVLVPNPNGH